LCDSTPSRVFLHRVKIRKRSRHRARPDAATGPLRVLPPAGVDAPPPMAATRPADVLIVWGDPDGQALAQALDRLIADTFDHRVTVWLSTREIGGRDWRGDVQRAAGRSVACILALGPAGPATSRLVYQAGACFREGTTFAIGCDGAAAQLRGTPLETLPVRDAHEPSQVKAVIRAVGRAAGQSGTDVEIGLAGAAAKFQDTIERLAGGAAVRRAAEQEATTERERRETEARRWAARRRVATLVAVAAALIVIAFAPWAWALWPSPARPPDCESGSGEQRAQCQWERLVAGSGLPAADPHRAARIAARPFAVLAFTPTCEPRAVAHEVQIAGQGAAGDGWGIPVLFARASADTTPGIFSAVTVAHGGRVDVLAPERCVGIANGAMRLRYIGTLGDGPLCQTLRDSRRAFLGNPGFVDQFTGFLQPFGLDDPGRLRSRVASWLTLCGVA
jgi:hypothetical protein